MLRLQLVGRLSRLRVCQLAECSLTTAPVVGPVDPTHQCEAQLLSGGPFFPVEDVGLDEVEERFHGGVVRAGADGAHRLDESVCNQGPTELRLRALN